MNLTILALGLAALATVGCQKSSDSGTKTESYSYDFTQNGCPTGKHTAKSVPELCSKLEDHTLNKNCAYGLRAAKFKEMDCYVVLGNKPAVSDEGHPFQSGNSTRSGFGQRGSVRADTNRNVALYSYDFTVNNCATGVQTADSVREICKKLEDHGANNYCAIGLRADKFKEMKCNQISGL